MLLVLETSGIVCGAALYDNGKIVASRELVKPKAHDAVLTQQIRELFSESRAAMHDLEAVAYSQGPGSFTGLRIGLSIAKALCFSLHKPLVAVPTHDALAFAAGRVARRLACRFIYAATMATASTYYVSTYDADANPLGKCRVANGADTALAPDEKTLAIGDAASYFWGERYLHGGEEFDAPHVRFIARHGAALLAQGKVERDPVKTVPLYVAQVSHRKILG